MKLTILQLLFLSYIIFSTFNCDSKNDSRTIAIMEQTKIHLAQKIKQTFTDNITKLEPYNQSHFSIRVYRITGERQYHVFIKSYFDSIKEQLTADLRNWQNPDYIHKRGNYFLEQFAKSKSQKNQERYRVFQNKLDHLVLFKLIETVLIWKDVVVFDKTINNAYQNWQNDLKKLDLKTVILQDDIFKHYSTQLISLLYQLKHHNMINIIPDFKNKFFSMFVNNKHLDDNQYKNMIYTMTHFIIGDSIYYQRFVSAQDHKWILDYFQDNIHEILKRCNSDIIAEVGLCFKLTRINEQNVIRLITEYLLSQYDDNLGYIPRQLGTLQASEHTNSVCYLFFSELKQLYSGPFIKN